MFSELHTPEKEHTGCTLFTVFSMSTARGSKCGSVEYPGAVQLRRSPGTAHRTDQVDLSSALNSREFSDLLLVVEGGSFYCHKVILVTRCPFFKATLSSKKALSTLKLNLQFHLTEGILEYIYTGGFSLAPEYTEELFLYAQAFQLPELERQLESMLNGNLVEALRAQKLSLSGGLAFSSVETEKMREKRREIVLAIADSEVDYVRSLQLVQTLYVRPLQKSIDSGRPILADDQMKELFHNWTRLVSFHTEFLSKIQQRIHQWDSKQEIGDIFFDKILFFLQNYDSSNAYEFSWSVYNRLKSVSTLFASFCTRTEKKLGGANLSQTFALPLARITYYRALLNKLSDCTICIHSDSSNLHQVLLRIMDFADSVELRIKESERMKDIQALQHRIENSPSNMPHLAVPSRKLLREGILTDQSGKNLQAFLFSDILLLCKRKRNDRIKFFQSLYLPSCSVNTGFPNEGSSFQLVFPAGRHTFTAPKSAAEIWIADVSNAIAESKNSLLKITLSTSRRNSMDERIEDERQIIQRRSKLVLDLFVSEFAYVEGLRQVVQLFLEPLQESLKTQSPVIGDTEIKGIFSCINDIYVYHCRLLRELENRVCSWKEESKLGDLFMQWVVNCSKMYNNFIEGQSRCVAKLLHHSNNNTAFSSFLVRTETDNAVSLPDLLAAPVKRMSQYYIALEELFQHTARKHPDQDSLRVVVDRLKEQSNVHSILKHGSLKQDIHSKKKKKASSLSLSLRKKATGESRGSQRFASLADMFK